MSVVVRFAVVVVLVATAVPAPAAIILFDLSGKSGAGLLPGNENPTVVGTASGGEVGAGISFDNVSNILTIHVGWGTGKGFSNMTGAATAGHIHGPTASVAPASFTETSGVLIPLDSLTGWDPSATAGGFDGTANVSVGNVTNLMNGQLYINIHTTTNGGGEIRGYLVPAPVPEPSSLGLLAVGLGGHAVRRFRRKRSAA